MAQANISRTMLSRNGKIRHPSHVLDLRGKDFRVSQLSMILDLDVQGMSCGRLGVF
jgi:hypothetical protein